MKNTQPIGGGNHEVVGSSEQVDEREDPEAVGLIHAGISTVGESDCQVEILCTICIWPRLLGQTVG